MLTLFLGLSCKAQEESNSAAQARQLEKPTAPRVHADRKELLFRYVDPTKGEFETATSIAEIPESAREKVVVYDPGNDTPGWFFLADLRKANADGSYPCEVVAAGSLRLVRVGRAPGSEQGAEGKGRIVRFFSASWCGVCKTARAFLKKQGIRFIEKDVERDAGASKEIQAFAKRKKIAPERLNSVPIFIIGSEILFGFDADTILRKTRTN